MDVGLTGLIASKLAPTDFCVVRTCCEQLLPPVGASLLAIAVVQLHSGWICRWLLISTPRQSKETQKKRRFPFLKEAPFFLSGSITPNRRVSCGRSEQENRRQSQENEEPAAVGHSGNHDTGTHGRITPHAGQGHGDQDPHQCRQQQVERHGGRHDHPQ